MKIRRGFVTNSSSSSFIITTDREILSKDDLEKYLIEENGGKHIDGIKDIAECLFRNSTDFDALFESIEDKYYDDDDFPDRYDCHDDESFFLVANAYLVKNNLLNKVFGADINDCSREYKIFKDAYREGSIDFSYYDHH